MSPHESPELRLKRHKLEAFKRGALMTALAVTVIGLVVKYIPNNFTSEHVKPPVSTEQTVNSTDPQGNITSQNIAENIK